MEMTLELTEETKHKKKKVKKLFKKVKEEAGTVEETVILEILETMMLGLIKFV